MSTFERRLIIKLARTLMEQGKAKGWSDALKQASKQVAGGAP